MKLLLMGAGYVGMELLKALQYLPHEILITTTKQEKIEQLKTYGKTVHLLKPNQDDEFQKLIDSCDGMIVLVAPKDSSKYEETYLETAKNISSALKGRKKPFYLLYTSSTSVYEGLNDVTVSENMILNPPSENAKILLKTEKCYIKSNQNTCILRLGGIYGQGRELEKRAKRLSEKMVSGTGDESTNNIHLEDIVEACLFCLKHSLTGTYNLVNDDHQTRKTLYFKLCQSLQIPPPIFNPDPKNEKMRGYIVSNQKIKESGFTFKHSHLEINQ